MNNKLQQKIADRGGKADFAAATGNFSREELVSCWSHKHAAYIAGLGIFGRHHMLITESGPVQKLYFRLNPPIYFS